MTDEQWSDLTYWLKLPDAARMPIEKELNLYQRRAALTDFAGGKPQRPSETKKKLERATSLASELLCVIETFEAEEIAALTDPAVSAACSALSEQREQTLDPASVMTPPIKWPVGAEPRIYAAFNLFHHNAHLAALHERLATASVKIRRGKTGSDPSSVRALFERISEIVETHTGQPLSKGKLENDFAEKLGSKLAAPPISVGSIKGAIESLSQEKLSSEDTANSG